MRSVTRSLVAESPLRPAPSASDTDDEDEDKDDEDEEPRPYGIAGEPLLFGVNGGARNDGKFESSFWRRRVNAKNGYCRKLS